MNIRTGPSEQRTKGTPQGAVVSPLLGESVPALTRSMHGCSGRFPSIQFERYADDAIVHCRSEEQARSVLEAIRDRLAQCGLELHPTKTRIVYCKDDDRPEEHEHISVRLPRLHLPTATGEEPVGEVLRQLPAGDQHQGRQDDPRQTIRNWRMASTRNNQRLEDLAQLANPVVRGWLNYYGRFYRSKCVQVLRHLNEALGSVGATEVQAVPTSGTCVDALAGAHRPPRSQLVRPVASRRAAGGWSVGAG